MKRLAIVLCLMLTGCGTGGGTWAVRAFGRPCWPFTNGETFYEASPCKDACRTWLKTHQQFPKRGKTWYFVDADHWAGSGGRGDRYHSIVWYIGPNGVKHYYDPLRGCEIELTQSERASIVYEGI